MTKASTRVRSRRATQNREGVRHAWALPNHTVLSRSVHGDLRLWDTRTGEMLRQLRTPSPVLFGSLVGATFCYVTQDGQFATYDVKRQQPIWITPLHPEISAEEVRGIERLGASHLAFVTKQGRGDELVHVLGPFPDLPLAAPVSKAEYGVPLAEQAVIGDGVVSVKRVPVIVEPFRRGRSSRFFAAPELRRKIGKVESRFCIAGSRIITIGQDARDYCDAFKGGNRDLWAWDVAERCFIGRVDVLDEVSGDGYLFPVKGDLDDPILLGALGFPSGRVLSWGREQMHLWSAERLELECLLPKTAFNAAFLIGDDRLVAWSRQMGNITSWKLPRSSKSIREVKKEPVRIKPHPSKLTGVCHLSGNQLLSWHDQDPVLRVWNLATGKHVRDIGA